MDLILLAYSCENLEALSILEKEYEKILGKLILMNSEEFEKRYPSLSSFDKDYLEIQINLLIKMCSECVKALQLIKLKIEIRRDVR